MEKIIKRSIIVISIIILIIFASIIIINLLEAKDKKEQEDAEIAELETVKVEDVEMEESAYRYFYTNDVLNKLFAYISETEKHVKNAEALVNLLDKDYIKKNNITEENVFNVLNKYKGISSYFSKEIYRREIAHRQDINGKYYYIKGIARKEGKEEYIYVLMKQDLKNLAYSISIMTEEEYNLKPGANEEISIVPNSYNKTYSKKITEKQMCIEFLNDYINTIKNNPEKGYELLNKEYRQKRFGNIQNYIQYINIVNNRLLNAVLMEYTIKKQEEVTQYICKDQTGNYYIFEQSSLMDYNVILDTYTMNLPVFNERYTSANVIMQGTYNIERCFESINNKDYAYVYNKLNEAFKNNNYKTQSELESTLNNNLFYSNKVEITYKTNEGNIYIYEVKVTDSEDSSKNTNMEVIMVLKDNNNFEMSFSFKN